MITPKEAREKEEFDRQARIFGLLARAENEIDERLARGERTIVACGQDWQWHLDGVAERYRTAGWIVKLNGKQLEFSEPPEKSA